MPSIIHVPFARLAPLAVFSVALPIGFAREGLLTDWELWHLLLLLQVALGLPQALCALSVGFINRFSCRYANITLLLAILSEISFVVFVIFSRVSILTGSAMIINMILMPAVVLLTLAGIIGAWLWPQHGAVKGITAKASAHDLERKVVNPLFMKGSFSAEHVTSYKEKIGVWVSRLAGVTAAGLCVPWFLAERTPNKFAYEPVIAGIGLVSAVVVSFFVRRGVKIRVNSGSM